MVDALGVTATIPVGKTPQGIAYDSAAKAKYSLVMLKTTLISVISDSTNTVHTTVPLGVNPLVKRCRYFAKGEIYRSQFV